ncbi:hypothetical protein C8Q74DRAFT_594798 [Fomes fomentarius]|nr:hypothetical protein C8Q74DRAFT_594798 [Fomes fomentarius]
MGRTSALRRCCLVCPVYDLLWFILFWNWWIVVDFRVLTVDYLSIRLHAARDRPYLHVTLCRLGRLSRDGSTMARTSASFSILLTHHSSLFHAPCPMSDAPCGMWHGTDPAPRTHTLAPSDATASMLTRLLACSRSCSWTYATPTRARTMAASWVHEVVPEPERAQVSPREGDVHERRRARAGAVAELRHHRRDACCSVYQG